MSQADVLRKVWLTTDEVRQTTGISRTTVYEALQTGELRGYQRAKHKAWRVHTDDVDMWIRGGQ
jgi:excisionase family DNA binding protein